MTLSTEMAQNQMRPRWRIVTAPDQFFWDLHAYSLLLSLPVQR